MRGDAGAQGHIASGGVSELEENQTCLGPASVLLLQADLNAPFTVPLGNLQGLP